MLNAIGPIYPFTKIQEFWFISILKNHSVNLRLTREIDRVADKEWIIGVEHTFKNILIKSKNYLLFTVGTVFM